MPLCLPRMRWLAVLAAVAPALLAREARAAGTLRAPDAHPHYQVELDFHLALDAFDPPGVGEATGAGPGIRSTWVVADGGFIRSANDSVGVGVGFDWLAFTGSGSSFYIPIVMQWNFWLSHRWSMFVEPGIGIFFGEAQGAAPTGSVGGRVLLGDGLAVTFRAGYPGATVGFSSLL